MTPSPNTPVLIRLCVPSIPPIPAHAYVHVPPPRLRRVGWWGRVWRAIRRSSP